MRRCETVWTGPRSCDTSVCWKIRNLRPATWRRIRSAIHRLECS